MTAETEAMIAQLAAKDPSTQVREKAIDAIGELSKPIYRDQFITWTKDSSYLVAGAALDALEKVDSAAAIEIATKASKTILKKRLNTAVTKILSKYGDESNFDFIAAKYAGLPMQSEEKFYMTTPFAELLIKTNDEAKFKKGIDLIVALRNSIPDEYKSQTDPYFNSKVLGTILKEKKKQGAQNLVQIIIEKLPGLN